MQYKEKSPFFLFVYIKQYSLNSIHTFISGWTYTFYNSSDCSLCSHWSWLYLHVKVGPELMDQTVNMWQPTPRQSSCPSCSQNGSSDGGLPNGCNHDRLVCLSSESEIWMKGVMTWNFCLCFFCFNKFLEVYLWCQESFLHKKTNRYV